MMTRLSTSRARLLAEDLKRMIQLRELNPSCFDFEVDDTGQEYLVILRCASVCMRSGLERDIHEHRVTIALGPDYPVKAPVLIWRTPIFHPNIYVPRVCLLGHWGAGTPLDEVCIWLWDMARYRMHNLKDPLDKSAAKWSNENKARFPFDHRALLAPPREHPRSDMEILSLIGAVPRQGETL